MKEPKSSIALVLKNGTQIATKCPEEPNEVEKGYIAARESKGDLRIEDGSEQNTIIIVRAEDVALFSVAKYMVTEKERAEIEGRKNGVLQIPPQRIISPR